MPNLELLNRVCEAIANQNWAQFKQLESEFVGNYGVEAWEDAFNFRILPVLKPEDKKWILAQKCGAGIKSIKTLKND